MPSYRLCSICKKTKIDPRHFACRPCSVKTGRFKGKNCPSYKNGRTIDSKGYVLILNRDHPHCNHKGYVLEHRLIMEKHLGRFLRRDELIHHINGIEGDNRIENLLLTKYQDHKLHYSDGFAAGYKRGYEESSKKNNLEWICEIH